MCMDLPLRSPNCTVYSVGLAYDWSFDEAIAQLCHVNAFDPTLLVPSFAAACCIFIEGRSILNRWSVRLCITFSFVLFSADQYLMSIMRLLILTGS